jgi:hypothetical protein
MVNQKARVSLAFANLAMVAAASAQDGKAVPAEIRCSAGEQLR